MLGGRGPAPGQAPIAVDGCCNTCGEQDCWHFGPHRLLASLWGSCNGCGEVYVHPMINDPPKCEPCDKYGNYVGDKPGCKVKRHPINWFKGLWGVQYADGYRCGGCEMGCDACVSGGVMKGEMVIEGVKGGVIIPPPSQPQNGTGANRQPAEIVPPMPGGNNSRGNNNNAQPRGDNNTLPGPTRPQLRPTSSILRSRSAPSAVRHAVVREPQWQPRAAASQASPTAAQPRAAKLPPRQTYYPGRRSVLTLDFNKLLRPTAAHPNQNRVR